MLEVSRLPPRNICRVKLPYGSSLTRCPTTTPARGRSHEALGNLPSRVTRVPGAAHLRSASALNGILHGICQLLNCSGKLAQPVFERPDVGFCVHRRTVPTRRSARQGAAGSREDGTADRGVGSVVPARLGSTASPGGRQIYIRTVPMPVTRCRDATAQYSRPRALPIRSSHPPTARTQHITSAWPPLVGPENDSGPPPPQPVARSRGASRPPRIAESRVRTFACGPPDTYLRGWPHNPSTLGWSAGDPPRRDRARSRILDAGMSGVAMPNNQKCARSSTKALSCGLWLAGLTTVGNQPGLAAAALASS